jgi:DNA-binding winged helix-turn-helix (wHTH) protein/TolB-like protein/Flp pilus assembly protein TadD
MSASHRFAFGGFVLERRQQRLLRADGTELGLTPRLYNALVLFVERPGELLDKDALMRSLWPGLVVEENNLSQAISALRRALGDDAQGSRFIQTVPRRGFRFIAEVTALPDSRVGSDPAAPADASPAQTAGAAPATLKAGGAGRRRWLSRALTAGAAAAGLAGAGWWAWRRAAMPADDGPAPTLAVLPFRPLASEGRDELLELGMADSLAARLSTVPGLVVRSTGSVLRFKGHEQDPLRAARELDVGWIVDGTLQRRGDRLRVTARLLNGSDGTAAWAGSFDETLGSVFDVQDQISAKVMASLAPALRAASGAGALPSEEGGTRSTEAYELYLAAAWRAQGSRGDSADKAISLLQEALAIDPNYALAWTLLAWAHRRRLWRNDAQPAKVFEAANAATQRALALTPRLAQALASQAFSLYWHKFDWPGAERAFRAALASNANEVSAQWGMAQLLLMQGRLEEGFTHMRQARELDPMSPVLNALEGSLLVAAGKLSEARKRLDRATDIAPEHGLVFESRALLLWAEGQPDKAIGALGRSVELSMGSSRPAAVLAARLAQVGQHDEARLILGKMLSAGQTRYLPPTHPAIVLAALGEAPAALDALERAYAARDPRLIYLKDDWPWAPLRQEPRYQSLLARLGLDRFGQGLAPI